MRANAVAENISRERRRNALNYKIHKRMHMNVRGVSGGARGGALVRKYTMTAYNAAKDRIQGTTTRHV